MQGKMLTTMTVGAVIGIVAVSMLMPNMDRSVKRRVKRTGKMVMNIAGANY